MAQQFENNLPQLTQSLYSIDTANSRKFGIRPLVIYCNISVGRHHDRHLVLSLFGPLGVLAELSRSSLRRLARWRLMAPLKIVSIVTMGVPLPALLLGRRRSCKKSVSKEFGASVSLRNEISDGEVTSVWMYFNPKVYWSGAFGSGLLAVGEMP